MFCHNIVIENSHNSPTKFPRAATKRRQDYLTWEVPVVHWKIQLPSTINEERKNESSQQDDRLKSHTHSRVKNNNNNIIFRGPMKRLHDIFPFPQHIRAN